MPDGTAPLPSRPDHSLEARSSYWRAVLAPAAILLVALLARIGFLWQPGFPADEQQFLYWAQLSAGSGLASVYQEYSVGGRRHRWCNYPPGYVLVLRGLASVYPIVAGRPLDERIVREASLGVANAETRAAWALFKAPAVAADLAICVVLWCAMRRRGLNKLAWIAGLGYALNPAVIFDSVVWGQVDSIHTLWMLLSLEAAARRRPVAMSAWAAVAMLTKAQAVLLVPVWGAVLMRGFAGDRAGQVLKRAVSGAAVAAAMVVAALLPFGVGALDGIKDAYSGAVGYYSVEHLNGFSAWFVDNPLDRPRLAETPTPYRSDRRLLAGGITRRAAGMAATLLAAGWVVVRLWRRRCDEGSVMWGAMVLPLAFFVLPTQIHERYLVPAVALAAWGAGRMGRNWVIWGLVSAAAFVNQVWAWPGPAGDEWLGVFEAIFHTCATGILFAIGLAGCLIVLIARPGAAAIERA